MLDWRKVTAILCIFVALKEFRPSEPFVTDYLIGPWKNFTATEVNQDIFPVGTYLNMITLVVIFLVTDLVRYKPILIMCGVSGVITYIILIFGKTIFDMQLVQFFYGLFYAPDSAHYAYIYAKIDKKNYQEATGCIKAVTLISKLIAGVTAQLTVMFHLLDYYQLNFLTLAGMSLATVAAFCLPGVKKSTYFHSVPQESSNELPVGGFVVDQRKEVKYTTKKKGLALIKTAFQLLSKHFVKAYTDYHVLKWSLWWAFATCGHLQVINYIQLLWNSAVSEDDKLYNGAVDAILTLLGAGAAYFVGRVQVNWHVLGEATLAISSLTEGALLLIGSYSSNIFVLYVIYIVFGIIYHVIITVASFEVAKRLSEDSYGLVFGINIWFALVLQSILTFTVVSENGLGLGIKAQYAVYGGYFMTIGIIFSIVSIFTIRHHYKKKKTFSLWATDEFGTTETVTS